MGVGEEELTPGQDVTGYITNPGFEDGNIGGWTVTSSADTGAKGTTNATYAALGTEGNYVFNHWSDGTEITQNIGKLPAGIYQLSAKLATGDSPELKGTVYLTLNGNKSVGMTSRNGNKQVMRKETITFVSDGNTEYTIGAVGAELAGGGHWWYKADDFKLTYINTKDNLYNEFKRVYDASAPWTASGDYYTFYNEYASYTNSTEQTVLHEAINYMNSSYDDYAWENASEEHPYDITDLVIKGADMTSNDAWPGSGRTQGEGQHWNGNPATKYFSFSNGEDRHQTVTIPYAGKYELRTAVRTLAQNAWAEIVLGDASAKTTDITGATGGNINIDGSEGTNNMAKSGEGYGWMFNKVSYIATGDNKAETITIKLSNKDKNTEANAGGMKLYYVGDTFDFVENGVHYWYGDTKEPTISLTNEVPVADLTNARLTGTANITSENTNGLVFKTSTQSVSGVTNNVVSDGTCANLVLTHNGGTFKAHKNFEATNASYTMDAIASNGKVGFGTLMLPFAVSTLPNSGKAYSLDQGVTFGEEINATEVSSINANTPVLVTAAGNYSASNAPVAATNDTYENGELVGTYKAMTAEAGTYVLQKHDNRVAFFLVGDTKPTVNPFRAYIKSQGTASAPMRISINFEDEATGISEVEADGNESAQNAEIYDLMGRKVVNPAKGIYIVNGKKVLISK